MKRYVLALAALLLSGCQSSSESKGNEGPNGGDIVAQQAATTVAEVVALVESSSSDFPEVNLQSLKDISKRVKIIIREKTYANGIETDATNNGFDQIDINASRWPKIIDQDRRVALIFHELLGLLGLERNSYGISSRLLMPQNRFAQEQIVKCGPFSCKIRMRYDRTQKAIVIESDGDCPYFERPLALFYRHSRKTFATSKPCVDPDNPPPPDQPVPCSSSLGPENLWSAIQFLDGGRFFFEGMINGVKEQFVCRT